jgi:urease accessory protein
MNIYSEILGNVLSDTLWQQRLNDAAEVEYIFLDQWTAQKSRFVAHGNCGNLYAVALQRQQQLRDGDVLSFSDDGYGIAVIRLNLSEVMVIDLQKLITRNTDTVLRRAVELGHAIGNQHWPAVVKGTTIYVPLTVDKRVMLSVMDTHRFEDVTYHFEEGAEVIPYLSPHEIRRLFGATSHH